MPDEDNTPGVGRRPKEQPSRYHNVKKTHDEKAEEEKIITPIVEGRVIVRKKGAFSKIRDFFAHEDSQSIGEYVLMDVALPAVRDLIFEMINAGAEKTLYPDTVSRGDYSRRSSRTPYDRISTEKARRGGDSRDPRSRMSAVGRKTHNFKEVILEDRAEAEEVLTDMYGLLDRFQMVTVADVYGLVGEDSDFIDSKWGWTNLDGAKASRVRGGYMLILPPTEELD